MDGYERYGLTQNTFNNIQSEKINDISKFHVNFKIDDHLGDIKTSVFKKLNSSAVLLIGDDGIGKTERLIVASYETQMNNMFSVFYGITPSSKSSVLDLIDVFLQKQKTSLFKSYTWQKALLKCKKTGKNGYNPNEVGLAIASALNENTPSFLLVDDIHNLKKISDQGKFIEILKSIIRQITPGVFIMFSCEKREFNRISSTYPTFKNQLKIIEIPSLTSDEAKQLLSKRLISNRIVDDLGMIYPFSDESVDFVNRKANGNPRLFINYSKTVLNHAVEQLAIMIDETLSEDALHAIKSDYIKTEELQLLPTLEKTKKHLDFSEMLPEPKSIINPMLIPQPVGTHANQTNNNPIDKEAISVMDPTGETENVIVNLELNESLSNGNSFDEKEQRLREQSVQNEPIKKEKILPLPNSVKSDTPQNKSRYEEAPNQKETSHHSESSNGSDLAINFPSNNIEDVQSIHHDNICNLTESLSKKHDKPTSMINEGKLIEGKSINNDLDNRNKSSRCIKNKT